MSLGQQAKLLRVLESGELIPVGAEHPVQVDVRLVAATNQNLDERVQSQEFRADLLFRIETVQIRLPPLRERREDIPLLVAYFLERTEVRPGQRAPRLGGAVMKLLLGYDWPGNVRELEHSIEHAVLVAEGDEIGVEDLPPRLRGDVGATAGRAFSTAEGTYRQAKQAFERAYLTDLLERTHGSVSAAARIAGIHRATLHEKLKRLGIGARD
jgi:DNA-binding NtrC family response regulator